MSDRLKKIIVFSLKYLSLQLLFALIIAVLFKNAMFLSSRFFGLGIVSVLTIVVFSDKFK